MATVDTLIVLTFSLFLIIALIWFGNLIVPAYLIFCLAFVLNITEYSRVVDL